MILGADFCDEFVQAIRPYDKMVELEDGTAIPILQNSFPTQQRSQQKDMRIPYGHVTDDKTPSPLIRHSAKIDFPAQSQA